jgi:hypothetical protein
LLVLGEYCPIINLRGKMSGRPGRDGIEITETFRKKTGKRNPANAQLERCEWSAAE